METKALGQVKFLGTETKRSKNTGQNFDLVILVDEISYDKFEFFKRDEVDLTNLNRGDLVEPTFKLTKFGFNTNIDLVKLTKFSK